MPNCKQHHERLPSCLVGEVSLLHMQQAFIIFCPNCAECCDCLRSPHQQTAPPPVVLASTSNTTPSNNRSTRNKMPLNITMSVPATLAACTPNPKCLQRNPCINSHTIGLGTTSTGPRNWPPNSPCQQFFAPLMPHHAAWTVHEVGQCFQEFQILLCWQPHFNLVYFAVDFNLGANPHNFRSR